MTFQPLLEEVRATASGERALASVVALAGFHRIQASPGYDAAARWLSAEITGLGLTPEVEIVPGDGVTRSWGMLSPQGWECRNAVATLVRGAAREQLCDFAAGPLTLIQRSAPVRGRFELVALPGDGTEDADYAGVDVAGRVVLARGGAHRVHTLAVVERGARGILCDGRRLFPPVRGPADDPDQIAYTSFWWAGDEPRGWGFVVSPRVGAALRAELAGGVRLELDVEVDTRRFDAAIPLTSARIAGGSPEEILVVAHLCHPQPGANDNASGAAAALETARVLVELATRGAWRPQRSVRFLWVPELTGTYAWLANDPARARRIVAAINLDMVGEDQEKCGSTFLLEHPPCFAASFAETLLARIRGAAQDWIASYSGPGHYSLVRMAEVPYSGGSDHAVFIDPAVGVPCPMLIQWPDRFYHSSHDTPDKTDPRSLELAVRCAATYAGHLSALDPGGARALLASVARAGRARVLEALEAPDPERSLARAVMASRRVIASCARLGVAPEAQADAEQALAELVARETAPNAAADSSADRARATDSTRSGGAVGHEQEARVPRRRVCAPLDTQRHLVAGHPALPREARERLRRLELDTPSAPTVFELAWYACDGARSLSAIADLVEIESGVRCGAAIAEWFEWTVLVGLSEWATSPSEL